GVPPAPRRGSRPVGGYLRRGRRGRVSRFPVQAAPGGMPPEERHGTAAGGMPPPPSVGRWQPGRLARAFGRHGLAEGRADDYRRVIATGPVFVESVRYRRRRTAWVAAGVVAAGGMVDVLEVG